MTEIEANARTFERSVRTRNAVEFVAVGIVVAAFAAMALTPLFHAVSRLGAVVIVASALWIGWVLLRKGHVSEAPDPTLDSARFLDAHRASLMAQAELLAWAPLWYVAPAFAGFAMVVAGYGLRAGDPSPTLWVGVPGVVVFAGVAWLNVRAARKLRERVDTLTKETDSL